MEMKTEEVKPAFCAYTLVIDARERELSDINHLVKRFERLLQLSTGYEQVNKNNFDVEEVKLIPIGDIMPHGPKVQQSSRNTYICPLHNENTPSFVWFKDKNNYKCFGCQAYGSVIDLYMAMNDCDFVTACKSLSN